MPLMSIGPNMQHVGSLRHDLHSRHLHVARAPMRFCVRRLWRDGHMSCMPVGSDMQHVGSLCVGLHRRNDLVRRDVRRYEH